MDASLTLATIRDDTRNVLNMQHITSNSKSWKYSDIPSGGHKGIKGLTHKVKGGHHLRKAPTPTHRSIGYVGVSRPSAVTIPVAPFTNMDELKSQHG